MRTLWLPFRCHTPPPRGTLLQRPSLSVIITFKRERSAWTSSLKECEEDQEGAAMELSSLITLDSISSSRNNASPYHIARVRSQLRGGISSIILLSSLKQNES